MAKKTTRETAYPILEQLPTDKDGKPIRMVKVADLNKMEDDVNEISDDGIIEIEDLDKDPKTEILELAYDAAMRGDLSKTYSDLSMIAETDFIDFFIKTPAKILSDEAITQAELVLKLSQILYENTDESLPLTDDEYDMLRRKFKSIVPDREPVGAPTVARELSTSHNYPDLRGTLNPVKNIEGSDSVEDFLNKIISKKIINRNNIIEVVSSDKYDGVSVVGTIRNGRIIEATTRGDEDEGMDVTRLFDDIVYPFKSDQEYGVKFEGIVTKSDLEAFNNDGHGKTYVNARAAASGIVNNIKNNYGKYMTLVPIQMSKDLIERCKSEDATTTVEQLKWMNDNFSMGVDFIYDVFKGTVDEYIEYFSKLSSTWMNARESLNYLVDGIVIDIQNDKVRKSLGRTNSINMYQLAYKYPSDVKRTRVTGVSYTVGHTGLITPMAHFKPVTFYGNVYDHVTIYSKTKFDELALRENDIVDIQYNNDVMPYLVKNDRLNDNNESPRYIFPKTCPSCGEILEGNKRETNMYCVNNDCESIKILKLSKFLERLGVKRFSEATCEQLLDEGIVKSIIDLFTLTEEDLQKIPSFKELKSANFIAEINQIKSQRFSDADIFNALGVNGIGLQISKALFAEIPLDSIVANIDTYASDVDRITWIETISTDRAKQIIDGVVDNLSVIKELYNILDIVNYGEFTPMNMKKVSFTRVRPDDRIKSLMEKQGYMISENMTKDCVYLITDVPSSINSEKALKADRYNIPRITIQDFDAILLG